MKTTRVKQNSKYQKLIDRSFAVILHNLNRIRDDTSSLEEKAGTSETKSTYPVLLHNETQGHALHYTTEAPDTKPPGVKKVSFSN